MKIVKCSKNIVRLLAVTFIFCVVPNIKAQVAYGVSDIVYDTTSGRVFSLSGTYLDARARAHYDPAVCGQVSQVGGPHSSIGCYTGYNSYYPNGNSAYPGSSVWINTINQAPPDTEFDIVSAHYVVAYFWTDVFISDDPPVGGAPLRSWYDPLDMRGGGGFEPGWNSYQGAPLGQRNNLYDSLRSFLLGYTGKAVIANPTVCIPVAGSAVACPTPTPTPLKVVIKNDFTDNQDLGSTGTTYNALLGATVNLRAETTSGSSSPISFSWKIDGQATTDCDAGATCRAYFDDKKTYTVSLVTQQAGQPTVSKSVPVVGVLPQLREDLSQGVKSYGFSGIERKPLITSPTLPCATGVII